LRHWRDRARSEGRLYGIGFAAVVEPAISNMGYITTVLNPEERDRAGAKSGAQAAATVSLDPLGGVSVAIDSVPQGQGHRLRGLRPLRWFLMGGLLRMREGAEGRPMGSSGMRNAQPEPKQSRLYD
jgi:hypothetical protein